MSVETGTLTILHLSDVHATTDELLYGHVDGLARLEQVGHYSISAGVTPEAVVVTGDLVQRGHTDAYPALKSALRRLGDVVGAPVLTVLGNHDSPIPARQLPGHEHGHHREVRIGPLRFILLDSNTGTIDPAQLAWLTETLRTPYGLGTVIALHHAPVPSPLPTLSKTGLRNPGDLAQAIAGSDARIILAGHYHHPMSATFHGVPVSAGPSLAYHQIMDAGPGMISGYDLAMFSLVQITDSAVIAAPISLLSTPPLFSTPVSPLITALQP